VTLLEHRVLPTCMPSLVCDATDIAPVAKYAKYARRNRTPRVRASESTLQKRTWSTSSIPSAGVLTDPPVPDSITSDIRGQTEPYSGPPIGVRERTALRPSSVRTSDANRDYSLSVQAASSGQRGAPVSDPSQEPAKRQHGTAAGIRLYNWRKVSRTGLTGDTE
jgi:hypothetical protein